ncbi:putative RNA polymerase sigma factor [Streptomyces himastatinicus ATCC 53653]|uniref:Putative RNA polymerase sigma factor n=1 Tax=Streptomyces himastatinicus ATCC 53653 TaxID=457427 RepID=D9WGZ3_9ACTN|nr:putative RNA polymerase sigma factor [Streptomyces himastatinicus ATCC 53653]
MMSAAPARTRRRHDDAPDTAADFERLAAASDGPERDLLAEELVRAWLPMAHRLAGRYRNRGENLDVRVPINHPCSSRRVLVFVEGSAESVLSVDCQVGELGLLGDGRG